MTILSLNFIGFFIVFFCAYWLLNYTLPAAQNSLLLLGSYFFYSLAGLDILLFLVCVSLVYYLLGLAINHLQNQKYKKRLMQLGVLLGIGSLIYFKYTDFFILTIEKIIHSPSASFHWHPLHLLIPLGLSFFIFRVISYIIDVEKGKIEVCRNIVIFFNYVSFFPTIVSGPIDKAITFIPQLKKQRMFEYSLASDGLKQILWGVFKKTVVADNIAVLTTQLLNQYSALPASTLWIGVFLFSFQLYADFSGYSDMAIGIGKLLGFKITKNFDYPLFAQNIAEFWRKWHISLTTWLTEYLFTPLTIAFRDWGNLGIILAIIINFSIIGFWHGANLTFILFGFVHGCLFIPLIIKGIMNKKRPFAKDRNWPTIKEFVNMSFTFLIVSLSFVLFFSSSISKALLYFRHLFSSSIFYTPVLPSNKYSDYIVILFILFMLFFEWKSRGKEHALSLLGGGKNRLFRWSFYVCLIFIIGMFMQTQQSVFLYEKF